MSTTEIATISRRYVDRPVWVGVATNDGRVWNGSGYVALTPDAEFAGRLAATQLAIGETRYELVIPEPIRLQGYELFWHARIGLVDAIGDPIVYTTDFVAGPAIFNPLSLPPPDGGLSNEWSNQAELQDEIGLKNLQKLASLDSDGRPETVLRVMDRGMKVADQIINQLFLAAGFSIPLTPLSSIPAGQVFPTDLIRLCASKIAHWQIYNERGKRDNDKEGDHVTEKYNWAVAMIQQLIEDDLPAVRRTDPTTGKDAEPRGPGVMSSMKIQYANQPRRNRLRDEYTRPTRSEWW